MHILSTEKGAHGAKEVFEKYETVLSPFSRSHDIIILKQNYSNSITALCSLIVSNVTNAPSC